MKSLNKEIVCLINDLIEINDDRIKGYETAAKETKEEDLKNVFLDMVKHSKNFKEELIPIVLQHDGKIEKGGTNSGAVYRAWMDIKIALTGKNRKAILSSCEFGEDMAHKLYESTLKNNKLPANISSIIEKQSRILKSDHDKIKGMRDLAVA